MTDLAFITDGSAAVAGLVLGLISMGTEHCPGGGCLARSDATPRTAVSAGAVVFQENTTGTELYVRRDTAMRFGPFRPVYGLSLSDDGEAWVGAGLAYTLQPRDWNWYAEFHLMPGLYAEGSGADLGGPVEFRSGLELGFESERGWRIGLGFDHRSNAGIESSNPGLETVHLRLSFPTGRR